MPQARMNVFSVRLGIGTVIRGVDAYVGQTIAAAAARRGHRWRASTLEAASARSPRRDLVDAAGDMELDTKYLASDLEDHDLERRPGSSRSALVAKGRPAAADRRGPGGERGKGGPRLSAKTRPNARPADQGYGDGDDRRQRAEGWSERKGVALEDDGRIKAAIQSRSAS